MESHLSALAAVRQDSFKASDPVAGFQELQEHFVGSFRGLPLPGAVWVILGGSVC